MNFTQSLRKIAVYSLQPKGLILLFIVFSVLFIGGIAYADYATCPSCSSCSTCGTDYWSEYWNVPGSCPGGNCSASSSCSQSNNNYCGQWGETYCSGSNVYRQRNCYNGGCRGSYTNSYVDTQVFQYCTTGQTCQNGQCVNQQQYYCDSFGSNYCSGNAIYHQRVCHRVDAYGASTTNVDVQIVQACVSNQNCQNGQCINQQVVQTYFKHFKASCSENDLFWFDSDNQKQDIYRTCVDNNQCTNDSCSGSKCLNELKCDGSTCDVGSGDYCNSCSHCGDNQCNCGETLEGCYQDCKALSGLPISILAKKEGGTVQRFKDLALTPEEKIDFLLVVSNNENETLNDVVIKTELPKEIVYKGDLRVNNNSVSGDIRDGINIGSLAQKELKTVTFKGTVVGGNAFDRKEVDMVATVKVRNLSADDSLKLTFSKPAIGTASIGDAIRNIFSSWLWLAVLGTIIIFVFALRMIYIWFFKKA